MSDLCWCKVRWWGAQWQQQQQQEGRHHQASSAFSSVLGSSSTPAAAAAVRCILLGTTCTSANLAGWTEQGPEGGEGRVKGGGEGGVFGFPKKSTMYSSYSGRTRFLQGPYLGPSGLTGWPNCKLYKNPQQSTNTDNIYNCTGYFWLTVCQMKGAEKSSLQLTQSPDGRKKCTFWNNLWGMQRSVSFFLVGADGAKSCKRLKHIWQLQQSKKRLIHWYRVIQQSRLCYCFTMQPVLISFGDSYLDKYIWCLIVQQMGNLTSGYID